MNIFKIFLIFVFGFSLDSHIYSMKNENNGFDDQDLENGINLYEWLEEEALQSEEVSQPYVDEKGDALLKECNSKIPSLKAVKTLLLDKADVNKKNDQTDQTPLHLVCQKSPRSIGIIEALINFKANVNAQDYLEESPLYELCKKIGHFYAINLLIKNKADINTKNSNNDSAFHIICKNPKIDLINLFIQNGAEINNEGRWGNTPLHVVCNKKNPPKEVVETFIENKAELSLPGKQLNTPLHLVCKQDLPSIEIIKILIENKADQNCKNKSGRIPLVDLCNKKNPSLEAIKTFITLKADINGGCGLLHSICDSAGLSSEIIHTLIEGKANPQMIDTEGNTSFHNICKRDNIDFIIAFISSIINVNCQNFVQVMTHLCNSNPLIKSKILTYLCCLKEQQLKNCHLKVPKVINFEIFKRTISAFLNTFISIKNTNGEDALMVSRKNGSSNSVAFLNGLQEAIVQGYEALINYLRKASESNSK